MARICKECGVVWNKFPFSEIEIPTIPVTTKLCEKCEELLEKLGEEQEKKKMINLP